MNLSWVSCLALSGYRSAIADFEAALADDNTPDLREHARACIR